MEEGSTEESEEFDVLPAEEGQIKYILKIAMMAGTKRKEAIGLMKNLIGISNEMEAYILKMLINMAQPNSNLGVLNPYGKKKGRRPGRNNAPGHKAGRPKKQPAAGQQQLSFASMNGDKGSSMNNNNNNSVSSASNATSLASQQAAAAATAAAAAGAVATKAREEERYHAAINGLEKLVESIPNGSFTTSCVPFLDDDGDGLELDFDSDEEGNGEEGDGGDYEGNGDNGGGGGGKEGKGGGDGSSTCTKRKKGGATSQRMVLQLALTWMTFLSK